MPSPISVTLFGIVMLVKLLQSSNAESPMLVTLSGIVMLVKLSQYSNALLPMLVTPSGIVMLVRLLQPLNALYSMLVTLSGIVIFSCQVAVSRNFSSHPLTATSKAKKRHQFLKNFKKIFRAHSTNLQKQKKPADFTQRANR